MQPRNWRLSSQLARTSFGPEAVLSHVKLGSRIEPGELGWTLLEQFRAPCTTQRALDRLGITPDERPDYEHGIEQFIQAGVLVGSDEDEYLHTHGHELAQRFQPEFLLPRTAFLNADLSTGPADIQVAGVAFDRAAKSPGAARGPRALREASSYLPAHFDPKDGGFRGLWDHDTLRRLLEGAHIVDHGDICYESWSGAAETFTRIYEVASRMIEHDPAVPVFLGGDHSITDPLVRAVAAQRGPLFIVHFDAHTDLSPAFVGRPPHHGSVMDHLRRLPQVQGILQLGVRDFAPPWWQGQAKTVQISSERLRQSTPELILELIPSHVPCYVSIDIDVLDPSEAPGTGARVPGGARLVELLPLMAALGYERDIVGIDLVEIAPEFDSHGMTSHCGLRLLLQLLDGSQRRRARTSAEPRRSSP